MKTSYNEPVHLKYFETYLIPTWNLNYLQQFAKSVGIIDFCKNVENNSPNVLAEDLTVFDNLETVCL
jgi:hypothetical protein